MREPGITALEARPDRREAVPQILGDHRDFLIVTGLAGAAQDIAGSTSEAPNTFMLGGAMGGATMMGAGLALARPDRRVLVVTGDGDLLMSLGSLATIGALAISNLAILCIDNERYGETGNQQTHTGMGVKLHLVAAACGINQAFEVSSRANFEKAAKALRAPGLAFVLLKVTDGPSIRYRRNWNAVERKIIFQSHLSDAPGQR